jgi:hypothetical protein
METAILHNMQQERVFAGGCTTDGNGVIGDCGSGGWGAVALYKMLHSCHQLITEFESTQLRTVLIDIS